MLCSRRLVSKCFRFQHLSTSAAEIPISLIPFSLSGAHAEEANNQFQRGMLSRTAMLRLSFDAMFIPAYALEVQPAGPSHRLVYGGNQLKAAHRGSLLTAEAQSASTGTGVAAAIRESDLMTLAQQQQQQQLQQHQQQPVVESVLYDPLILPLSLLPRGIDPPTSASPQLRLLPVYVLRYATSTGVVQRLISGSCGSVHDHSVSIPAVAAMLSVSGGALSALLHYYNSSVAAAAAATAAAGSIQTALLEGAHAGFNVGFTAALSYNAWLAARSLWQRRQRRQRMIAAAATRSDKGGSENGESGVTAADHALRARALACCDAYARSLGLVGVK